MKPSAPSLLILAFAATVAHLGAVEIVGAPRVEARDTSAVVTWRTDAECGTHGRFGVQQDALNRKAEAPGVSTEHAVTFDGLQPGTTYFFTVGTSRKALAAASFTTSGKGAPPGAAAPKTATTAPKPVAKPAPATPSAAATAAAPAAARKAPPTKKIWGNYATLQDHYDRHGRDFKAATPDDYARMSWEFLQRAMDEGLPAKLDESDGTIRVWDGRSHTFGAYNRDFTTKTFFRPQSPTYFERQPGKPVKLKRRE